MLNLNLKKGVVRLAIGSDEDEIVRLSNLFHDEYLAGHLGEFDEESLRKMFKFFQQDPLKTVIVAELSGDLIGCVVGYISPCFFNLSKKWAQETMWYVEKNERKTGIGAKLLLAFEEWAKAMKADYIDMIHIENEDSKDLGLFYQKVGYTPAERHFVKGVI